jgi:TPR repeat protein
MPWKRARRPNAWPRTPDPAMSFARRDTASMTPRVPLSRALLRMYKGDGLFRSSVDFAVIGFGVYLFIAPLPLPSFDWTKQSGPKGPAVTSAPTAAPAAAPVQIPGIAQAATSHQGGTAGYKQMVHRQWFSLSDPSIVPALNRAADEIDKESGAAARAILDEIGRPDDPNVANLSAYAHLLSRDKDAMDLAYRDHLRAAEAGHPESMDQVGQMLRLGMTGHVDLARAADWYEKGAAAGGVGAPTNAGRMYYNGWARPVDHVKAVRYYREGAERGDVWGMQNYGAALVNGQGLDRDAQSGKVWIEKAAKAGLAQGQQAAAMLARKGLGGPRDLDAFLRWAQVAADQGNAAALYDLGMFYLEPDDGRAADPLRAAGYLRQAAVKKHGAAQFAYATLCDRGVGMPANTVQAFVYYSLALRNGETAAQARLDALRKRMPADQMETAERLVVAASP